MKTKLVMSLVVLATLALPVAAQAQGTIRGAEEGAAEGGRAAGPLGAIVGGAIGAATGTVGGILGVDDRPRFREYVVRERRPSYRYDNDVRVGVVLPESGVTYYDVPPEYRAPPGYRYTIVNDRPVLIEPRTGASSRLSNKFRALFEEKAPLCTAERGLFLSCAGQAARRSRCLP